MFLASLFAFTFLLFVSLVILSVSNIKLWIELKSMQKSTHQIMMPSNVASDMFQSLDEETREKMTKVPEEYDSIQ